jgi:hypothetical protein
MATITRLSSGLGQPERPDIVCFLESSGTDQVMVAGLHSIAGDLKILQGMMMDTM